MALGKAISVPNGLPSPSRVHTQLCNSPLSLADHVSPPYLKPFSAVLHRNFFAIGLKNNKLQLIIDGTDDG